MTGRICCANPLLPWLPGETLFSLCSRHNRLWGHSLSSRSTEMLFGGRRVGIQHDLPSALDKFTRRTESRFGTSTEVACNRTLLRFYRPFLHGSVVSHAVEAMRGPTVAHLKLRLGLLTSRFRANHPLKACDGCMHDDLDAYGWVYWHLEHQFLGVWMCPYHNQPLRQSKLKSSGVERFQWHLPDPSSLSREWLPSRECSRLALRRLAELTIGLVEHSAADGWLEPVAVQETLRPRLLERGWLTAAGSARLTEAASDYLNYCAPLRVMHELSELPSDLESAKAQIGRVIRPLRAGIHPLRLLVAIGWLFENASDFITRHATRAASRLVHDSTTFRNVGRAVDISRPRKDRLIELLQAGHSATAGARKLGIDVATAMVWAASAGVQIARRPKLLTSDIRASLSRDLRKGMEKSEAAQAYGISIETVTRLLRTEVGLHAEWKAARFAKARKSARDAWTQLLNTHGGSGTKVLRAMGPAAYAWLYRNDRTWLVENAPSKRLHSAATRQSPVRWDERDRSLSRDVERATLRLFEASGGKALRLWQIYQAVPGLKPKLAVLDRLPLTKRAIEEALRTRS